MAAAIAKKGRVVDNSPERNLYYGWTDFKAQEHMYECSVEKWSNIHEEGWDEFDGTFNDPGRKYGMEMTFTCACGILKDRLMRWEAPFGEAFRELLLGDT